jgi:hypothetical protein
MRSREALVAIQEESDALQALSLTEALLNVLLSIQYPDIEDDESMPSTASGIATEQSISEENESFSTSNSAETLDMDNQLASMRSSSSHSLLLPESSTLANRRRSVSPTHAMSRNNSAFPAFSAGVTPFSIPGRIGSRLVLCQLLMLCCSVLQAM